MNRADTIKIFLLGMLTAFVAMLVFRDAAPRQVIAGDAGVGAVANAGDLMAVTTDKDGIIYLVDPVTLHMAQYSLEGGRLMLRAARNVKYDLRIPEANQKRGISVEDAETLAKRAAR